MRGLTKHQRILAVEGELPATQRAIREAILILAEMEPRLQKTPIYERAATAEKLIAPIRLEKD